MNSVPKGWRILGEDEVISRGDKRIDKGNGQILSGTCYFGRTVASARASFSPVWNYVRKLEPTPDVVWLGEWEDADLSS